LSIGIYIGSISLKVAVLGLGEEGRADTARLTGSDGFWSPAAGPRSVDGNSYSLALSRYRRLLGRPLHTLDEVLRDISRVIPRERLQSVTVTGSGGKLAGGVLSVPFVNEFKAIAKGFEFIDPDVRTVFEMGGESSKFLRLEYDGDSRSLGIVDFEKNGDCAAGTGSFIDQQAARLRFTVEEVGEIALGSGKAAAIAGRCSVFAKSDMIHAQQKGFSPAAILKGLCAAVARNFKGTVVKGKQVEPPVAFIGGVSRNAAVVQALEEAFGMQPGDLRLPEAYAWTGAVGASLLAMEDRAKKTPPALEELQKAIAKTHVFSSTEPLSMSFSFGKRFLPMSFPIPPARSMPFSAWTSAR
jgi:predicted CoA-substrate-specific enzyme activase